MVIQVLGFLLTFLASHLLSFFICLPFSALRHLPSETCLSSVAWKAKGGHLKLLILV